LCNFELNSVMIGKQQNKLSKAGVMCSGPNEVFADFKLGIFGDAPMSLFPRLPGS